MKKPEEQAASSSYSGSEDAKPRAKEDTMHKEDDANIDGSCASEKDRSVGNADDNNSEEEQSDEEDQLDISSSHKKSKTIDSEKRKVYNGMIEFDVEPIKKQIICCLCEGLYREPYTTIKCFHTFCKSCLATALSSSWNTKNFNCCPECGLYFGRQDDLTSIALPDRTLETLIDKVLFPELAKADEETEAEFYRKRGISRKDGPGNQSKKQRTAIDSESIPAGASRDGDMVIFQLIPERSDADNPFIRNGSTTVPHDTDVPPPLDLPFLQTQGSIRMGQLKKYIRIKLNLDHEQRQSQAAGGEASHGGLLDEEKELEILCNAVPLGNELSVTFVARTVWMDPINKPTLHYRYAKK